MAANIHPTAIVHPEARLRDGVVVGPHVTIEADVTVGDDCELMVGAVVRRFTTLGRGNVLHPYAVLGGVPQDHKFDAASRTHLRIGDGNVFREYVTISRATTPGGETVVGSGCYFMTQSHVGHDSLIGDGVVLTNSAAAAGHVEIGPGAVLSANTLIHQFCWIGELVMTRGHSGASQHVPPFVILGGVNQVDGLNAVGLRRAKHITADDRRQIKEAYRLLYRSSLPAGQALAEMDSRQDWAAAASRFRDFVRRALSAPEPHDRGVAPARARNR